MTKVQKIVGIDISKETFDTATKTENNYKTRKFDYTNSQIQLFINSLTKDTLCVMESTGIYHLRLAYKLFEAGIPLAVVNPLSAKRFIQSSLSRSKTDKTDACRLIEFAQAVEPKLWQPEENYVIELRQLLNIQADLIRDRTSATNQLEAIRHSVHQSTAAIMTLSDKVKFIDNQIDRIDTELEKIIVDNDRGQDLDNVDSIKGVGKKTATVILAMVPDISKFDNAKQLASFLGMCPSVCQSGTSVRGRGRICKMGNHYIRMLLYMCARSAKRYNLGCKELYQRLLAAGKPKKLALIAVANKLIRQIFAILKSKQKYDENYIKKLAF